MPDRESAKALKNNGLIRRSGGKTCRPEAAAAASARSMPRVAAYADAC
jgi:hypothetical protein